MKYYYQLFDGDDWVDGDGELFDTPLQAKKAGVEAGFDYVRVMAHKTEDKPEGME